MANALPQAIGAQVSHPGRQVISMSGDGGFAMLMGDLLTLRQQQLPVKVIVLKNDSLAFVELEMKAVGILDFGTKLHNPDFAKIAEGAGSLGLSAKTADDVHPMLEQALKFGGPALVEIPVRDRNCRCPQPLLMKRRKDSACSCLEPSSTAARTRFSTWRK
jgi:pyruvate dehydrogenase (quinone)